MDISHSHLEEGNDEDVFEDAPTRIRQLPADLPKSLDDRQPIQSFGGETEMYDAWQGRVRASIAYNGKPYKARESVTKLNWQVRPSS